jgi:hypothetical protein
MKFDTLCSIAHNFADSFGSGASLLFNNFSIYPYDDIARSPNGVLEIDFLNGRVISGTASAELIHFISMSPRVLDDFCKSHGTSPEAFNALSARYVKTDIGQEFEVTVEDRGGRRRTDRYDGVYGKRLREGKHPPVSHR